MKQDESLSFSREFQPEDLENMVAKTLELFETGNLQESNELAVYNVHNLLQNMAEYAKNVSAKISDREKLLMQQSAEVMSGLALKAREGETPQEYLKGVAELIDESVTGTNHARNSISLENGTLGEYRFSTDVKKQIEGMKEGGYLS